MLPLPENVQLGTFQLIYAQPEVCPQVVNLLNVCKDTN